MHCTCICFFSVYSSTVFSPLQPSFSSYIPVNSFLQFNLSTLVSFLIVSTHNKRVHVSPAMNCISSDQDWKQQRWKDEKAFFYRNNFINSSIFLKWNFVFFFLVLQIFIILSCLHQATHLLTNKKMLWCFIVTKIDKIPPLWEKNYKHIKVYERY